VSKSGKAGGPEKLVVYIGILLLCLACWYGALQIVWSGK
jgi:hypothetical protein